MTSQSANIQIHLITGLVVFTHEIEDMVVGPENDYLVKCVDTSGKTWYIKPEYIVATCGESLTYGPSEDQPSQDSTSSADVVHLVRSPEDGEDETSGEPT